MWDYGALSSDQEEDYIRAKMKMPNQKLSDKLVIVLTDLIATSQSLMRHYASQQLRSQPEPPADVEVIIRLNSCL